MRQFISVMFVVFYLCPAASANSYQSGANAYLKRDYATAYRELFPLAQEGHADAQLLVGDMYRWGEGVGKNVTKAIIWYRKSAEQGNRMAQETLGIYYDRRGNRRRAFHWLTEAANQDSADAQYRLAKMYVRGKAVTKDIDAATELFISAAKLGNPGAQTLLGIAATQARVTSIERHKKGVAWLKRAARKNHSEAHRQLGRVYLEGIGVSQNAETAANWFQKAARQGNLKAQFDLGKLFESGNGVRQSNEQAFYWYRVAERGGLRSAAAKDNVASEMDFDQIQAAIKKAKAVKIVKPLFYIEPGLLTVVIWNKFLIP
jgi:TPR repeat protein